ncbi:MAG: malto-oligosyltrehalose trehalohydrolase [Chitinivibrionales bacterium]|nr:malto-oligosyltrehalose trehalohydrolase [Chitinivibrionales bacterium]
MDIGARYRGNGRCDITVWAPTRSHVEVRIDGNRSTTVEMVPGGPGYHHAQLDGVEPGDRYVFRLASDLERPDPASMWQPDGVHAASAIVDHTAYSWHDATWVGIPLESMVFYELHVGAFTPERTFAGIVPRLDELRAMGVTAVEIMPVAQFPGSRNWGYDGVYPFAVQHSYGGIGGLKLLVDECHARGLAVVLDVVYNHLGPEGNYLHDFGPYFTGKYQTPWGMAVNFDDEHADEVRNYFIQNALYWLRDFHIDALRLDAVHAIYDRSAHPFLQELAEAVEAFSIADGRKRYLIAESDLNDSRIIRSPAQGGYGLDAQWSDDFHHSLHTLLTGESNGYYKDFGSLERLAKAFTDGFVYSGQYSGFRKRRYGNTASDLPGRQFVVCTQNHDQVGNRMLGERLSQLVDFESQKLAASALLLSPYLPLLFMGEEYGETNPFLYFVSHTDPELVEAVRQGRKREFEEFHAGEGEPPDAQDEDTLARSTLDWSARTRGSGKVLLAFHTFLLELRAGRAAFGPHKDHIHARCLPERQCLVVSRGSGADGAMMVLNFAQDESEVPLDADGEWVRVVDSADTRWEGPGVLSPERVQGDQPIRLRRRSCVVYQAQTA